MHTSETQRRGSWYDTPFGRLCERDGQRRPQPSVADVIARLAGASR
jgi:hypothetical protein